jgi:uncharacterized protein YjbI with pentapeptide repeats
VQFVGCKLSGVRFDQCHPLGLLFSLSHCLVYHANFYNVTLKNTCFQNTAFTGADFTQANFSGTKFLDCQLDQVVFDATNLEKANLSSATGFNIDPERNRLKGAIFSRQEIEGLLSKYGVKISD